MKLTNAQMDEFRVLRDELQELERDKARLDWLEKDGMVKNIGIARWTAWDTSKSASGKTVREAIDNAMKK